MLTRLSLLLPALGLGLSALSASGLVPDDLPLKPARTIEFETDEGTWTSLDVSPDGNTILFDLLGDLYTLPAAGGRATPITSGLAFDSQPRFSPDGTQIVFLSDRGGTENVYIARADGTQARAVTADVESFFASPIWTPDGRYLIVSRRAGQVRGFELWMYHVDGGAGVRLTVSEDAPKADGFSMDSLRGNALGPTITADGRYLYYAHKTGGKPFNLMNVSVWQVRRRDLASGAEQTITQAPGGAMRPWVSRDGRFLVFGTRDDGKTGLRIRDLETQEERWLKHPVSHDDMESPVSAIDLLPGYAFMPDQRAIVVSIGGKLHRIATEPGGAVAKDEDDRIIPFIAPVSQKLGPELTFPRRVDEGPVRARIALEPALSPDGRTIAFAAFARLYVMDVAGGRAPRRVTPETTSASSTSPIPTSPVSPGASTATGAAATTGLVTESQPAWSPDGQWLAYVTWTPDGGGHLWRVRADGSAPPEALTPRAAYYRDPVWSHDGTRVFALAVPTAVRQNNRESRYLPPLLGTQVIAVRPGDREPTTIGAADGATRPHLVTTSTDRVYLQAGHHLMAMRLADGALQRVVRIAGDGGWWGEWSTVRAHVDVRVSPDGGRLLVNLPLHQRLVAVTVPPAGLRPLTLNIDAPSTPLVTVSDVGADSFGWSHDGATIHWTIGSTFHRLSADALFQSARTTPSSRPAPDTLPIVVERPRPTPAGSIVLRGARVVTMQATARDAVGVIENADLVVTGTRIAAVGRRGAVAIPAGATTIDVHGATIVPGMIDTHAHWPLRTEALEAPAWPLTANLAYGVTTGRDPSADPEVFAYQDLVAAGLIRGLRIYSTGPPMMHEARISSPDRAVRLAEKYRDGYGTHMLKSYVIGTRRQQQLVVQAAQQTQMMPTTEGMNDLKLDLTHVLDGFSGNEHALPIAPLYEDTVQLVARAGTFYTPTLVITPSGPTGESAFYTSTDVHDDPKLRRFVPHVTIDGRTRRRQWFHQDEYTHPAVAAAAARIARAGGKVCIGSHGQMQGLAYHWEMWALAQGGMTPREILRAATLHGAEAIGLAQDLGSLEAGKLADLVILSKNPLDDIRHTTAITYVMQNGVLYAGDTLNAVPR